MGLQILPLPVYQAFPFQAWPPPFSVSSFLLKGPTIHSGPSPRSGIISALSVSSSPREELTRCLCVASSSQPAARVPSTSTASACWPLGQITSPLRQTLASSLSPSDWPPLRSQSADPQNPSKTPKVGGLRSDLFMYHPAFFLIWQF